MNKRPLPDSDEHASQKQKLSSSQALTVSSSHRTTSSSDESSVASSSSTSSHSSHNKSGKDYISVYYMSESDFQKYYAILVKFFAPGGTGYQVNKLGATPCMLLPAKDGRISYGSQKVAYGYQLVAREKWGNASMTISASKSGSGDSNITISHLCGTSNCCNAEHMVLESKKTNDERTHCHYCLNNILASHPIYAEFLAAKQMFHQMGSCVHNPRCGTNDVVIEHQQQNIQHSTSSSTSSS